VTNKFAKLVHLVGFITKKFVTMHGHMNVKWRFRPRAQPCKNCLFCSVGFGQFRQLYQCTEIPEHIWCADSERSWSR